MNETLFLLVVETARYPEPVAVYSTRFAAERASLNFRASRTSIYEIAFDPDSLHNGLTLMRLGMRVSHEMLRDFAIDEALK